MIAEQTEIMFGVLQIIFSGHPVASLLGITGQSAIFLEQLGGVAALAVIQPSTIIVAASHLLRAWARIAATTPPPLVVPDQDRRPRCMANCRPLVGGNTPRRAIRTPGAGSGPSATGFDLLLAYRLMLRERQPAAHMLRLPDCALAGPARSAKGKTTQVA